MVYLAEILSLTDRYQSSTVFLRKLSRGIPKSASPPAWRRISHRPLKEHPECIFPVRVNPVPLVVDQLERSHTSALHCPFKRDVASVNITRFASPRNIIP